MKVSDPIMFGHAVKVFFKDVFARSTARTFAELGVDREQRLWRPRWQSSDKLPRSEARRSRPTSRPSYDAPPPIWPWWTRDKGITNLHVPSDVIIDASMPAMIRASGTDVGRGRQAARHAGGDPGPLLRRHLPGGDRRLQEARRLRSADHGQCPNVGLMAQAAEEYGSHDKTFEIAAAGTRARRRRRRQRAHRAQGREGRHLAHVPDQGRRHPGLGEARRERARAHRPAGHLLARRSARLRSRS